MRKHKAHHVEQRVDRKQARPSVTGSLIMHDPYHAVFEIQLSPFAFKKSPHCWQTRIGAEPQK